MVVCVVSHNTIGRYDKDVYLSYIGISTGGPPMHDVDQSSYRFMVYM